MHPGADNDVLLARLSDSDAHGWIAYGGIAALNARAHDQSGYGRCTRPISGLLQQSGTTPRVPFNWSY